MARLTLTTAPSIVGSDPGSSVSSTGLTPSQLADRRSARNLQLKMLKIKLAADERKAERLEAK